MCKLNIFDKISLILIFIGSINWGTIGLFKLNLLSIFLFNNSKLERIMYIIILLGALDLISLLFRWNLFANNK
ncbi:protein of unknown function DUF378 [Clostridium sp. DL-VIII]|uniref:DUF378 domain-containing protein n=1 Tax=Clostridium sp. DL-VIII TaxID=641107 RepID=UPI00023AFF74|nr:DUF378 domain-containing protein [Clostridium sp. DL-VIII]EHI98511.1 protein of unknown function DUF378 [Clostridium sp. DL-VIII]